MQADDPMNSTIDSEHPHRPQTLKELWAEAAVKEIRPRKKLRNTLLVALLSVLALISCCVFMFDNRSPHNRASAIEAAREWARLAPFPESAQDIAIDVQGSMFTREFVITFRAPADDVKRWIQESPGPREAKRETRANMLHFSIEPGGGAQWAEMDVSPDYTLVRIHTYWS